jgi:hypothetical protein
MIDPPFWVPTGYEPAWMATSANPAPTPPGQSPRTSARPALVNGAAGWVTARREAFAVAALTRQNGRITTMDILLDPERPARLDLTVFD